jgi:SAM-dependent methyltransferase
VAVPTPADRERRLDMSAAVEYAARVDAVLAQRTRLRGPQPPGDLFAGLPPDHPVLKSDPRRQLEPNLEIMAAYVEPDDVIVDVGGGAGRLSLPLALRCREVIDVDPSGAMLAGFEANARQAGIANVRAVHANWLEIDPPRGMLVLVNHVTYLTQDIVPFVEKLEAAASRRVLMTVNSPPAWTRELYRLVHGEAEEIVPGHVELVNVLWELGIEPDVRMLPDSPTGPARALGREVAVQMASARFRGEQWAAWPLGDALEERLAQTLDEHIDALLPQIMDEYAPAGTSSGREVLITWEPRR